MKAIRDYAHEHVDREFLDDRRDMWNMHDKFKRDRPMHMYLKHPDGFEAHQKYHGWVHIIKEDLQCDARACDAFVELFQLMPPECPFGFFEANRILAHIFKDKNKPPKDLGMGKGKGPRENWSRFMENACEEAQGALTNHKFVKTLKLRNKAESSWGAYPTGPPGGPGSSGDHDLNMGKGMGKGKHFQAGPTVG